MEIAEMRRLPSLNTFALYEDSGHSQHDWKRYLWRGTSPAGYMITARYSSSHPLDKMDVTTHPELKTHHMHSGKRLCYLYPGEWNANFTAASVILIIFRFLDCYGAGRITD